MAAGEEAPGTTRPAGVAQRLALLLIGAYRRWLSPYKGFRCAHAALHGGRLVLAGGRRHRCRARSLAGPPAHPRALSRLPGRVSGTGRQPHRTPAAAAGA